MIQFFKNLRYKLAQTCAGLFAAPYLPNGLITCGLLLMAASLALILLGQPLLYWQDYSQAKSDLPILSSLLGSGPWAYGAAALAYLLLAWALTGLFTRRVALIAWLTFSFIHLAHLLNQLSQLIYPPEDAASYTALLNLGEKGLSALLLGIALSVLLLGRKPAAVSQTKALHRVKAWQAAAALIGLCALVGGAVWVLRSQADGWRQIKPAHTPGKRNSAALAYNTAAQKAILFGGSSEWLGNDWNLLNDLWEWDGNDWTQIQVNEARWPSARYSHAMAYDEKRNVVVLFGGDSKQGYLKDTWEWNGESWIQRAPPPEFTPEARSGATLYYDPNMQKTVLAGGYGGQNKNKESIFYKDVWAWDGERWLEIKGTEDNPFISGASAAYDSSIQQAVMMNYDGVWNWTSDRWTASKAQNEPPERIDSSLVPVPFGGAALFGGSKDKVLVNDLWFHRANNWEKLTPEIKPSPRKNHVSFYDAARSTLVIYSGYGNDKNYSLDDMWEYPLKP